MNPTGNLYLYLDSVGGQQLAYFSLDGSNNTQSCTVNTGSIPTGPHSLVASYKGDNNFNPADGSANITINPFGKGNVVVSVTPNPQTQTQGQPIAVTITLTPQ